MAAKGEREVRVRFTGESAVLKGSAGEVRKVFQMMTGDLNDTRSASEKLAAAQAQVAKTMKADMLAVSAAADVLADSLGPEMVQAIEASGRSVEDTVQEWRKLGLTLDEIKMDSDKLATGMKQLDDSARMSTGAVGDGFKKISAEADNSRSVVANFTGNMVSELPGVSGAFGPLNMAIGQFAEYATEGNIKMKQFIGAAGGLAVATVAFQLLSTVMERSANAQRMVAQRTDEVSGALEEQVSKTWELAAANAAANGDIDGLTIGAQALGKSLTLAGEDGEKLIESMGGLNLAGEDSLRVVTGMRAGHQEFMQTLIEESGLFPEYADQVAEIVARGEHWDQIQNNLIKTTDGTGLAVKDLNEEQKAYIQTLEDLDDVTQNTDLDAITGSYLDNAVASNEATRALVLQAEANTGLKRSVDGLAVYNEFNRLLGEADAQTRDAILGTSEYADALKASEDALQAQEDAQRAATEAAQAAEDAVRSLNEALLASIDTEYAVRDAQDQFITSMEALGVAVDDPKTGVDELRQAQDTATQSALAAASAAQANAEAIAIAAGAPLDAAAANQVLIDSLTWTALSLDENSPVRKALLDHIATLGGVPPNVGTTVTADTTDALGRIGFVKQGLEELGDTESTAETDAETQTAIDKVTTLQGAVDGLAEGVTIPVTLAGDEDTKRRLKLLRNELQLTIDKANEADRAVARVAG